MKLTPMFRYSLLGFLAVLSFAFLSPPSLAQSVRFSTPVAVSVNTFTGTVNNNWNNAGNWSGGIPVSTDPVSIANGKTCTMDIDATVASIVVQGGVSTTSLNLNSSLRTLTVTGAVTIGAPTANGITDTIVVGAGHLVIGGGLTLTGGSTSTQIADITIGSGRVDITGGITSLNPRGRVTFTTSGTLALTGNFPDTSALTLTLVASNGNIIFNRAGAQNIGAGHTFAELTVDSSGTKTVTGTGNITVNGGIILKGTAIFSLAGKTLTYGVDSRVEYAGSSTQTTGDEFPSTVVEVWVNNAAGVNLTGGARTVNGGNSPPFQGFDIQNGTFSDGGNQISCTSVLNVRATGGFKVGAPLFPAFSAISLIDSSTVEYAGGSAQDVVVAAYSNLIFSGAGTKQVKAGGALAIGGYWRVGSPVNLSTYNPTFTVQSHVSGSGVITMGTGTVTVIGDWLETGGTTGGGSGAVKLTGASATIIGTSFANLTLDNNTGAILSGAVTVNGTLNLLTGKASTDATNILRLSATSSVTGGSSTAFVNGPVVNVWSTGTLSKVFPLGKGSTYRPLEISLTTPLSPEIRAEVFNANAVGSFNTPLTAISVNRYYQTALLTGSGTGTVKINFGADDGVTSNGTLVVARSGSQSGIYTDLSRTSSTTAYVISGTYTPAATDFLLLGSTATNPLPVQLSAFSAAANRLSSELHWSTATETNNYGFEVERRAVGTQQSAVSWQKVGFVAGSGTSGAPREYSYADRNLASGRYAYRLKQVDNDGTFSYSGSAEVEIGLAAKEFKLESNYPNPFNPSTTIAFTLADDGKATLKVFNMLGQEVATLFDGEAQAGRIQQVKFDASRLPSGLYFAKLESGKQQMLRKMMLVK